MRSEASIPFTTEPYPISSKFSLPAIEAAEERSATPHFYLSDLLLANVALVAATKATASSPSAKAPSSIQATRVCLPGAPLPFPLAGALRRTEECSTVAIYSCRSLPANHPFAGRASCSALPTNTNVLPLFILAQIPWPTCLHVLHGYLKKLSISRRLHWDSCWGCSRSSWCWREWAEAALWRGGDSLRYGHGGKTAATPRKGSGLKRMSFPSQSTPSRPRKTQ